MTITFMLISKKSNNMFRHSHLRKCIVIFFFLPFTNVFAQGEIQYISYDSISKIVFIDKSIEDAEIESYDIVVINSHLKDTTTLCRNVLYVDSSAVELIGSQFFFISHENLIVYNMETAICDTIFRTIDGLNINAFCLIPENLAVVASVNYKTEDITFSVLDLTFNKILWNCNINETNVGLEYLRITMQGAGSDCIDVSTNQYDYCISLSEEICKKKN